jgi:hypothetical protein
VAEAADRTLNDRYRPLSRTRANPRQQDWVNVGPLRLPQVWICANWKRPQLFGRRALRRLQQGRQRAGECHCARVQMK